MGPPAALPNVILTAGVLPLSALRVRGDRGSCFRLDCKPARNIDHFLEAAAVVIQCVAGPVGVQRRCLFTG